MKKVEKYIAEAVGTGTKMVLAGEPHAVGGTVFEPAIMSDVPRTHWSSRMSGVYVPVARAMGRGTYALVAVGIVTRDNVDSRGSVVGRGGVIADGVMRLKVFGTG